MPEPSGEETPPPTVAHGYRLDGAVLMFENNNTIRTIGGTSEGVEELNRIWSELATRVETIASLRTEVDNLRYAQVKGDDPRLSDFWAQAQELANNANHCDVFDQIAEALGGPRRTREYTVTVSVSGYITIEVEATDIDDAIEQAKESYRWGRSIDFGELESIDEDWYNAEAELS